MKVKMFFTIIAGCMLLLAASCEKDPPPNLGTNDPPKIMHKFIKILTKTKSSPLIKKQTKNQLINLIIN